LQFFALPGRLHFSAYSVYWLEVYWNIRTPTQYKVHAPIWKQFFKE